MTARFSLISKKGGPLLQNFLDPRMVYLCISINLTDQRFDDAMVLHMQR